MTVWEPTVDLRGNRALLKVSATDASQTDPCGLQLAVKVRPRVWAPNWRQTRKDTPFILGTIRDIALRAHREEDTAFSSPAWKEFIHRQIDMRSVHAGLRLYVQTAVENYLEVHAESEVLLGPLRPLRGDPDYTHGDRTLAVWTPLYASEDGTAEVRRLRMDHPHRPLTVADRRWAAVAAYVTARQGSGPGRIRVLEIGLGDGDSVVLFDGTGAEAGQFYARVARDPITTLVASVTAHPGYSCGDCQIAGHCPAPVPLDGMTGQTAPSHGTRTLSPSAIASYNECPAQWLLRYEVHVPREQVPSAQQQRGIAAHSWLETAHRRGVACTEDDLPEPASCLGLADGLMDAALYEQARPFLIQHLQHCPLALPGYESLGSERLVVGYDRPADLLPMMRLDLLYRLADRVVVRETKTTDSPLPASREDAYNKWPQVAWALTALRNGLAERHEGTDGLVEIEVLGLNDSIMYTWATDELGVPAMAAGDVRRTTSDWHTDTEWETRPGPYCQWCPVRRWCPDRDTFAAGPAAPSGSPEATAPASFNGWSDDPPF